MDDAYVKWAGRYSKSGEVARYEGMTALGGGYHLRDEEQRSMDQVSIRIVISRAERTAFEAGFAAAQKAIRDVIGAA